MIFYFQTKHFISLFVCVLITEIKTYELMLIVQINPTTPSGYYALTFSVI